MGNATKIFGTLRSIYPTVQYVYDSFAIIFLIVIVLWQGLHERCQQEEGRSEQQVQDVLCRHDHWGYPAVEAEEGFVAPGHHEADSREGEERPQCSNGNQNTEEDDRGGKNSSWSSSWS